MPNEKLLKRLPKLAPYLDDLDLEMEGACFMPEGEEFETLKDSQIAWQAFDLKETDTLCLYGFNPTLYDLAKGWLRESRERKLIFIDDRPEAYFLMLHEGSEHLLDDPQIELHFFESSLELEPLLKEISWNHIFLRLQFSSLPSIAKEKAERARHQFDRISLGVHLVASDYSDRGKLVMENVYFNCSSIGLFRNAQELKGCFGNIPAVICGSGPSLEKHQDLLPELEDRALVFAGGSALGKMNGWVPHFAAAIDKQAPYHQHRLHTLFEAPFFFQNRMSKDNFSLIHTDKFLIGDNGGYPLEQWLCEQLGMSTSTFNGGWNVGTLLIQLAEFFGCSPIILVGMDLSVQDQSATVQTNDLFGNPVSTQRDWVMAAKWIEEFAKQSKAKVLNATEGGLGFEGVENTTFEKVREEILKHSYDLWGLSHFHLQMGKAQQVPAAKVLEKMMQIEKSLSNLEEICISHLHELQKSYSIQDFEKNFYLEEKMGEELAFRTLLEPLWDIWKYFFIREAKKDQQIPYPFQLALHQALFFKSTLDMHLGLIQKWKGTQATYK